MLIQRSYLDLSAESRRAGAKSVRDHLRASLRSPNLTPTQRDQIQVQLRKIQAWEAGTLHQTPPQAVAPAPQDTGDDPVVTLQDAMNFGLCQEGIEAWAAQQGVDPKMGASVSVLKAAADPRAKALGRKHSKRK